MFIGHAAVACAAKKAAPRVSLGVLIAAAFWLDLVWPVLVLLGIEQVRVAPGDTAVTPLDFVSYPWSHSALMAIVWSVAFGFAARPFAPALRDRVILGGLVFSHWALDLVVHRPDLPLLPGASVKVGLGLWNSVAGTVLVEGLLMLAGVWIYLRTTRARDAVGRYALWALVAFYVLSYAANLLGPPPPSAELVAWVDLASVLLPLWAAWADRHRIARDAAPCNLPAANHTAPIPPEGAGDVLPGS